MGVNTCGRVGRVRVAPPLDELGRKAVLAERGAVHHGSGVLERVDRRVRTHGDVLQGQPQSRAALVVLQLQIKSVRRERGLLGVPEQLPDQSGAEPSILFALQELVEDRLVPRRHSFMQRSPRKRQPWLFADRSARGGPAPSAYRPLLFCMLGLAPVFSRASAIRAIPAMTSAECFLGLNEQTRCRGVSTAPTVAAFT